MDVKYGSLEEAVRALVVNAENLDDPINNYIQNSETIGEDGRVWKGTAAAQARPVLDKLKADIESLQILCRDFAESIGISLENYEEADSSAVTGVYNNISDN
jgi:hypothetical protein